MPNELEAALSHFTPDPKALGEARKRRSQRASNYEEGYREGQKLRQEQERAAEDQLKEQARIDKERAKVEAQQADLERKQRLADTEATYRRAGRPTFTDALGEIRPVDDDATFERKQQEKKVAEDLKDQARADAAFRKSEAVRLNQAETKLKSGLDDFDAAQALGSQAVSAKASEIISLSQAHKAASDDTLPAAQRTQITSTPDFQQWLAGQPPESKDNPFAIGDYLATRIQTARKEKELLENSERTIKVAKLTKEAELKPQLGEIQQKRDVLPITTAPAIPKGAGVTLQNTVSTATPTPASADPERAAAVLRTQITALREKGDFARADALEKRLVNPAKWEAEQKAFRQTATPEQLAQTVQAGSADIEQQWQTTQQTYAALSTQRQAYLDRMDRAKAKNDSLLNQPYSDGDVAIIRDETTGEETRWHKAAADEYNGALQGLNGWQQANQEKIDLLDLNRQQLQIEAQNLQKHENQLRYLGREQQRQQDGEQSTKLNQLRQIPGMAEFADETERRHAEFKQRQTEIARKYPDPNLRKIAEQALQEDAAKTDADMQERMQAKADGISKLYTDWGKDLNVTDWQTDKDFTPRLQEEAKKAGLTEPEARKVLDTSRKLDWSRPLPGDDKGTRHLPDGQITVSPHLYLEPKGYEQAVNATEASPEAKKSALSQRRDLAAPMAAEMLLDLQKVPEFAEYLAKKTSGTPVERMEQFQADLREGGFLAASLQRFQGGASSLASSALGAVAAITGNDYTRKQAERFQQRAQAFETAGAEGAKGTNAVLGFGSKVIGAAPSMLGAMVPGGLLARLGNVAKLGNVAVNRLALTGASLGSGAQSFGGTYLDAVQALEKKGLSPTEAHGKALSAALLSGTVTTALTALSGLRGAESFLSQKELVKKALVNRAKEIGIGIADEAIEEGVDQLAQGIIAQQTYNPSKKIGDILSESLEAALIGGALGGGMTALSETVDHVAGKQALLAEDLAAAEEEITHYTDATVDSVENDHRRNRAALAKAIAQGVGLDGIEEVILNSAGWTRKDPSGVTRADGSLTKIKDYQGPNVLDVDSSGKVKLDKTYVSKLAEVMPTTAGLVGNKQTTWHKPGQIETVPEKPPQTTANNGQPSPTPPAPLSPAPASPAPSSTPSSGEVGKNTPAGTPQTRGSPPKGAAAVTAQATAGTPQVAAPAVSGAATAPTVAPTSTGKPVKEVALDSKEALLPYLPLNKTVEAPRVVRAWEIANHLEMAGLDRASANLIATSEVRARGVSAGGVNGQVTSVPFNDMLNELGMTGDRTTREGSEPLKLPADGLAKLGKNSPRQTVNPAVSSTPASQTPASQTVAKPAKKPDPVAPNNPEYPALRAKLAAKEISTIDVLREVVRLSGKHDTGDLQDILTDHLGMKKVSAAAVVETLRANGELTGAKNDNISLAAGKKASDRQSKPSKEGYTAAKEFVPATQGALAENPAWARAKLSMLARTPPARRRWAYRFLTHLENTISQRAGLYDAFMIGSMAQQYLGKNKIGVVEVGNKVVLAINLDRMLADFSYLGDPRAAAIGTIMEEDIHAAQKRLEQSRPEKWNKASLAQQWLDYPEALKKTIWDAYRNVVASNGGTMPTALDGDPSAKKAMEELLQSLGRTMPSKWSAAAAYHMQSEFLRMLVQGSIDPKSITETIDADPTLIQRIKDLLADLYDTLRSLIKGLPVSQAVTLDQQVSELKAALEQLGKPSSAEALRTKLFLRDPSALAMQALKNGTVFDHLATQDALFTPQGLARVWDLLTPEMRAQVERLKLTAAPWLSKKRTDNAGLTRDLLTFLLDPRAAEALAQVNLTGSPAASASTGMVRRALRAMSDYLGSKRPDFAQELSHLDLPTAQVLQQMQSLLVNARAQFEAAAAVQKLPTLIIADPQADDEDLAGPPSPAQLSARAMVAAWMQEAQEKAFLDQAVQLADQILPGVGDTLQRRAIARQMAGQTWESLKARMEAVAAGHPRSPLPQIPSSPLLSLPSPAMRSAAAIEEALTDRDNEAQQNTSPQARDAIARRLMQEQWAAAILATAANAERRYYLNQQELSPEQIRQIDAMLQVSTGDLRLDHPYFQREISTAAESGAPVRLMGVTRENNLKALGIRIGSDGTPYAAANAPVYIEGGTIIIKQTTLDDLSQMLPITRRQFRLSEDEQRARIGLTGIPQPVTAEAVAQVRAEQQQEEDDYKARLRLRQLEGQERAAETTSSKPDPLIDPNADPATGKLQRGERGDLISWLSDHGSLGWPDTKAGGEWDWFLTNLEEYYSTDDKPRTRRKAKRDAAGNVIGYKDTTSQNSKLGITNTAKFMARNGDISTPAAIVEYLILHGVVTPAVPSKDGSPRNLDLHENLGDRTGLDAIEDQAHADAYEVTDGIGNAVLDALTAREAARSNRQNDPARAAEIQTLRFERDTRNGPAVVPVHELAPLSDDGSTVIHAKNKEGDIVPLTVVRYDWRPVDPDSVEADDFLDGHPAWRETQDGPERLVVTVRNGTYYGQQQIAGDTLLRVHDTGNTGLGVDLGDGKGDFVTDEEAETPVETTETTDEAPDNGDGTGVVSPSEDTDNTEVSTNPELEAEIYAELRKAGLLASSDRRHPITGQILPASRKNAGPTYPDLKKPQITPATPLDPNDWENNPFGDWVADLKTGDLVGWRGIPYGHATDVPGGFGNTEGNGIYIAKEYDTAVAFGRPFKKQFPQPKTPFIVREGLYLLTEDEITDEPIQDSDSDWLKACKYAVQRAHNIRKGKWEAELAGDILTALLMEAGYDSVLVKDAPDDWVVLLRLQRPYQKTVPVLASSDRQLADKYRQPDSSYHFPRLLRGIGSSPNDAGVAGKGPYYTLKEHVAKMYAGQTGKVITDAVTLKRPLIATYPTLTKLQTKLYGRMLTGFEPELSAKFDTWMRERGYDGAILFEPEEPGQPAEVVKLAPSSTPLASSDRFYSQLARTVEAKMPNRADAKTLRGIVENPQNRIKAEELKWSGLLAWADSQPQPLTKPQVLDYLATEGSVRFEETRLNGINADETAEQTRLHEQYRELTDQMADLKREREEGFLTPSEASRELARISRERSTLDERLNALKRQIQQDQTRNTQWTLPGGENHREVVVTWKPNDTGLTVEYDKLRDQWDVINEEGFIRASRRTKEEALDWIQARREEKNLTPNTASDTTHYGDLDALAWFRANDRDNGQGLLVEEFQSKWHQLGRDKGYKSGPTLQEYEALIDAAMDADNREEVTRLRAARNAMVESNATIPDAPYRSAWPLMLFKRALADAVAEGKQWLGWTTGDTQADRYDLSKQVDAIRYWPEMQLLKAYKGTREILEETASPEQLPDYIGKDAAKKLLETPRKEGQHSLRGDDLKVGGEGMRKFYDDILVKEFGKYVKPWGGKVEKAYIAGRDSTKPYTEAEMEALSDDDYAKVKSGIFLATTPIWRIDITTAMRESVAAGQALFSSDKFDNPLDRSQAIRDGIRRRWKAEYEGESPLEAGAWWIDRSGNILPLVMEHGEIAEDIPDAQHPLEAAFDLGFIRASTDLRMGGDDQDVFYQSGPGHRPTQYQKRALEQIAEHKGGEVIGEDDPRNLFLAAADKVRDLADDTANAAYAAGDRSFYAYLQRMKKLLVMEKGFDAFKPYMRGSWTTIADKHRLPEPTRASAEADYFRLRSSQSEGGFRLARQRQPGQPRQPSPTPRPTQSTLTPAEKADLEWQMGLTDEPTPDPYEVPAGRRVVPREAPASPPLPTENSEPSTENGLGLTIESNPGDKKKDGIQNYGATLDQRQQAIDEIYGPLAPGVTLRTTKTQNGTTVPHIMRGRGIMIDLAGKPYVATKQAALTSVGTGNSPGVRFLPLEGDKSNWTGYINSAVQKVAPNLDAETDIYLEPYGGGLVYLQNLDFLRKTSKPVLIAVSQEFEPERWDIYNALARNDQAVINDIMATLKDPRRALTTETGVKFALKLWGSLDKTASDARAKEAFEQLPNLAALLQKPNVKLMPWKDNDTFRAAIDRASAGKRVTLLEDSNYADLPGENTADQYRQQDDHPELPGIGQAKTEFIGKDPAKLLAQKLPVYRAVIQAGGTVIATNNMNPVLLGGLLAEFGDQGHWFGYPHPTRPVPDGVLRHPDGKGVLWSTERPEYLAIIRKSGVTTPPKYGTDTPTGYDYRSGPRRSAEDLDRAAQAHREPSPYTGGSQQAAESLLLSAQPSGNPGTSAASESSSGKSPQAAKSGPSALDRTAAPLPPGAKATPLDSAQWDADQREQRRLAEQADLPEDSFDDELGRAADEALGPDFDEDGTPLPSSDRQPSDLSKLLEAHPDAGELSDIDLTAYRVGALNPFNQERGSFFGDDYQSAQDYANRHPGHVVTAYRVEAKKAFVAKNLHQAWRTVFGKPLDINDIDRRFKFQNTAIAWRWADTQLFRKLRGKGYDALILRAPAPPARHEIALIDKTAKAAPLASADKSLPSVAPTLDLRYTAPDGQDPKTTRRNPLEGDQSPGPGTSPAVPRRLPAQASDMLAWAREEGWLIDTEDLVQRVGLMAEIDPGDEHDVWFDELTHRAVKLTKDLKGTPAFVAGSPAAYLNNLRLQNTQFGTGFAFEGVVDDNGTPRFVISQPWITGTPATQEAKEAYFKAKGFDPAGPDTFYSIGQDLLVSDARDANVVQRADGTIQPIDLQVRAVSPRQSEMWEDRVNAYGRLASSDRTPTQTIEATGLAPAISVDGKPYTGRPGMTHGEILGDYVWRKVFTPQQRRDDPNQDNAVNFAHDPWIDTRGSGFDDFGFLDTRTGKFLTREEAYTLLRKRGFTPPFLSYSIENESLDSYDLFTSTKNEEPETKNLPASDRILAAAQKTNTSPSEAQIEAENYQTGKVTVHGLRLSIENPAGSVRRGTDANGKAWEVTLPHHYGRILGTTGADKDHVDFFLGPDPTSPMAFVVNQKKPGNGHFDEHKVMLGFTNPGTAARGYLDSYSPGWRGYQSIVPMTIPQLKHWLEHGKMGEAVTKAPIPLASSEKSPAEQIQNAGQKHQKALEKARSERLKDDNLSFEFWPSDDPEYDGDGSYYPSWTATRYEDEWIEKLIDLPSIRTSENNDDFYVGDSPEKFPTLESAKDKVRQKARDYLSEVKGTFDADMDGQEFSGGVFADTHRLFLPFSKDGDGWGSTKWGSYYFAAQDDDGYTIKLSIRDHDASRKDMGLPKKSWYVSKAWEPTEVAAALEKAWTWLNQNAAPIAEAGALESSTKPEGADAPTRAEDVRMTDRATEATSNSAQGLTNHATLSNPNLPASPRLLDQASRASFNHLDRWFTGALARQAKRVTSSDPVTAATQAASAWWNQDTPSVSTLRSLKELAQRELLPETVLPREIMSAMREMQIKQSMGQQKALDVGRALSDKPKFSDLHYPPEFVENPMHREAMFSAMEQGKVDTLPPALQEVAMKLRQMLVEAGREAVKQGRMNPDTFEGLRTNFMPRFTKEEAQASAGDFAKRFKLGVKDILAQRSTAFHITDTSRKDKTGLPQIVSHARGKWRFDSQQARDAYYEDLINRQTLEVMSSKNNGRKIDSIQFQFQFSGGVLTPEMLKAPATMNKSQRDVVDAVQRQLRNQFKKEDPYEPKDLVKDPVYAVMRYLAQMTHDNAVAEFFNVIDQNPDWTSTTEMKGFTQIPDNDRFGALAGKYVRKDIADQVMDLAHTPAQVIQLYDTLLRLWKTGKTVLNPATHARNIIGNLPFSQFAGNNALNPANWPHYAHALRTLRQGGDEYRQLYETGVLGADYASTELRAALENIVPVVQEDDSTNPIRHLIALGNRAAQWGKAHSLANVATLGSVGATAGFIAAGPLGALAGAGIAAAANPIYRGALWAYRLEDDLFKAAAFFKARSMGMNKEQAAQHVRDWFPYYDKPTSTTLKFAGRTTMPFLSFFRESARIGAKAAKERPLSLAATLAIPTIITALSQAALGLDDEDMEDVKSGMRGKGAKLLGMTPLAGVPIFSMLIPWRTSSGQLQQIDLSSTHPMADFLVNRVENWNNDPWWQAWSRSALANPMLGALYTAATGRDPFGDRTLWDSSYTSEEKARAILGHAWKTAMPPLAPGGTNWTMIDQSTRRQANKTLALRSPAQAVGRGVLGVDVRNADPDIYGLADAFRKRRGLPVTEGNTAYPTDAAGRARKALFEELVQPQPDPKALAKQLQSLNDLGKPVRTVADVLDILDYRRPDGVINPKELRAPFRASLAPEARRVLDTALREFQKARAATPGAFAKARQQIKPTTRAPITEP